MKGMVLIMVFIKAFILLLIFLASLHGGKIIAKKYSNRVSELKEMKNELNMFLTNLHMNPCQKHLKKLATM